MQKDPAFPTRNSHEYVVKQDTCRPFRGVGWHFGICLFAL